MTEEQRTEYQIRKLQGLVSHLEDELLRQGRKLDEKIELLKQSIPKAEHEKIIEKLRKEYEAKLSEINSQPNRAHNERGAGRKRIATDEVVARVRELHGQGLSQSAIATKLSNEMKMKIGRTTVGEIVRGKYG